MCEALGKLSVDFDRGDYLHGRVGHQTFFATDSGSNRRLMQAIRAAKDKSVWVSLVKGRLVQIRGIVK